MTRHILIYPKELAQMKMACAGEKYRPSNGTEGEFFFDAWCRQCARDKAMSEGADFDECDDNQVCGIIARTFSHDVDDSEYPTEWQYGKDGQPCCTAFIQAGEPIPEPRCELTEDMFENSEKKRPDEKCKHEWLPVDGNPEHCAKCGISFTRYVFMECP